MRDMAGNVVAATVVKVGTTVRELRGLIEEQSGIAEAQQQLIRSDAQSQAMGGAGGDDDDAPGDIGEGPEGERARVAKALGVALVKVGGTLASVTTVL